MKSRTTTTMLLLVLAAPVLASLSGCTILNMIMGDYVEPEFDIRDTVILVPAFRDGRGYHYESARGDAVGNAVAHQFQSEGGCQLVSDHEIEDAIIRGDYSDPPPWGEIGKEYEVDFVVVGWLRSVKISDGDVIGMLRGTAEVKIEVWDTRTNRVAHKKTFTSKYPEDTNKEVTAIFDITEDELERKLLSQVAVKISRLYCGEHKRR